MWWILLFEKQIPTIYVSQKSLLYLCPILLKKLFHLIIYDVIVYNIHFIETVESPVLTFYEFHRRFAVKYFHPSLTDDTKSYLYLTKHKIRTRIHKECPLGNGWNDVLMELCRLQFRFHESLISFFLAGPFPIFNIILFSTEQ